MGVFLIQLLNLYVIAIIGRIILSYFPIAPGGPLAGIASFLYAITEPVLGPLRNMLPSVGMFDLSPMVVIFVIKLLVIPIVATRL